MSDTIVLHAFFPVPCLHTPFKRLIVVIFMTGQLTKSNAEKLFLLVMPLADRNLFDALKHERWAQSKNKEEVRHMFVQLVRCVEHMHSKGMIHGDLKVSPCSIKCYRNAYQHILSTHPINAPYKHLLSTPTVNTTSTHSINQSHPLPSPYHLLPGCCWYY